jgi:hypothetical protein
MFHISKMLEIHVLPPDAPHNVVRLPDGIAGRGRLGNLPAAKASPAIESDRDRRIRSSCRSRPPSIGLELLGAGMAVNSPEGGTAMSRSGLRRRFLLVTEGGGHLGRQVLATTANAVGPLANDALTRLPVAADAVSIATRPGDVSEPQSVGAWVDCVGPAFDEENT